jgi:hypothetical protein
VEVQQIAVVEVEVLVVGVLCSKHSDFTRPCFEPPDSALELLRLALGAPGCRMCSRRGWL